MVVAAMVIWGLSHPNYAVIAGVNFQLPVHPGPATQHAASTNGATHAETLQSHTQRTGHHHNSHGRVQKADPHCC